MCIAWDAVYHGNRYQYDYLKALSVGTQSSIKSECNRRWTRRTCLELSSQIFPRPSAKFKWTLVIYFIEFGSVLDARMDSP
ncbi:hypothetical protein AVEN_211360-1 [Araneus ventricosus]|uniref:Uncharacterized protein n=1 Tax=Araneus ventricosus TaxID=182803 RepID=A0A4Y2H8R7_ARAVE|nr:hypothetical protein AVEN_211360-1 [Araneus ventricosus]